MADVGPQNFQIDVVFSEEMDDSNVPSLTFPLEDPASSLTLNEAESDWTSPSDYSFVFDVNEGGQALSDVDIQLSLASDTVGNQLAQSDHIDVFSIDIISSLYEVEVSGFTVFPNPTSGLVLITSKDNIRIESIEIFDDNGKLVLNQKTNSIEPRIDMTQLPDGTYLIKVNSAGNSSTQRIVKQTR